MHEDAIDRAALAAIYAGLERDAAAALEKDGIAPEKIALLREADLRYAGQSMEVRVPAPSGERVPSGNMIRTSPRSSSCLHSSKPM